MLLDMTIYNRLKILIAEKELRERRKLPYRVIAEESGISTTTLTKYMNQEIRSFDEITLTALCKYLGVQPGELLIYSSTPPTEE